MSTAREQLIAELVAERFGAHSARSERPKRVGRRIDDDITTARRRRELLNLPEDAPDEYRRAV